MWLLQVGMRGCSLRGVYGCSGGACVVAPEGACVVAPGGACMVAPGGACVVAPRGGMHGCSGGHVWDTMRYGDTVNERAEPSYWNAFLFLIGNNATTKHLHQRQ